MANKKIKAWKPRNPHILRKKSQIVQDKREKEAQLRHQQEMSKWVNMINDLRKESANDEKDSS
jgi:ribosomal protein L35